MERDGGGGGDHLKGSGFCRPGFSIMHKTGWVSMWAYAMLSHRGSTLTRALSPTATNKHLVT